MDHPSSFRTHDHEVQASARRMNRIIIVAIVLIVIATSIFGLHVVREQKRTKTFSKVFDLIAEGKPQAALFIIERLRNENAKEDLQVTAFYVQALKALSEKELEAQAFAPAKRAADQLLARDGVTAPEKQWAETQLKRITLAEAKACSATKKYRQAFELYFGAGEFTEAAKQLAEAEDFVAAAKLCERTGLGKEVTHSYWKQAAKAFSHDTIKARMYLTAAEAWPELVELLIKENQLAAAIEMADSHQVTVTNERWAELFEKTANTGKAVEFYLRANKIDQVIRLYSSDARPTRIIALLKARGEHEKVAEIYETHELWEEALTQRLALADEAKYRDTVKKALAAYVAAKDASLAGALIKNIPDQKRREAACALLRDVLNEATPPREQCSYLMAAGLFSSAAEIYEKESAYDLAAAQWLRAKNPQRSTRARALSSEAKNDLKGAAELWIELNDIEALRRVLIALAQEIKVQTDATLIYELVGRVKPTAAHAGLIQNILESLPEDSAKAKLYVTLQAWREAALLCEKLGNIPAAVVAWDKEGNNDECMRLVRVCANDGVAPELVHRYTATNTKLHATLLPPMLAKAKARCDSDAIAKWYECQQLKIEGALALAEMSKTWSTTNPYQATEAYMAATSLSPDSSTDPQAHKLYAALTKLRRTLPEKIGGFPNVVMGSSSITVSAKRGEAAAGDILVINPTAKPVKSLRILVETFNEHSLAILAFNHSRTSSTQIESTYDSAYSQNAVVLEVNDLAPNEQRHLQKPLFVGGAKWRARVIRVVFAEG